MVGLFFSSISPGFPTISGLFSIISLLVTRIAGTEVVLEKSFFLLLTFFLLSSFTISLFSSSISFSLSILIFSSSFIPFFFLFSIFTSGFILI
jgi:hypothetical protein